jgi:RNA polymerase sigma factor (TIGR02999 family)
MFDEKSDHIPDVTELLQRWTAGDRSALEQIIPLIYNQLRAMAEIQLRGERATPTLQPTALVHDLYLRLSDQQRGQWKDREHFFAFAAMMMRRILTDHARRTLSEKRGGEWERVPLSEDLPWLASSREDILAMDEALDALQETSPRKVRVLELRVLLGCTAQETAELLGISKATADREWMLARAWLFRELTRKRASQP